MRLISKWKWFLPLLSVLNFPTEKYNLVQSFMTHPSVQAFLNNSAIEVPGGISSGLQHEMMYIGLSNLAEACANIKELHPEFSRQCLEKTVEAILDPSISPFHQSIDTVDDYRGQHLFLSHMNIVLGKYQEVIGDDKYEDLNISLTEHLADATRQEKTHTLPSYGYTDCTYLWPADQTATLYSLWLYDRNYGTQVSVEPITVWIQYMNESGIDSNTKLHVSELSHHDVRKCSEPAKMHWRGAPYTRGCAMSMSLRYMAFFAPEEAQRLWVLYKQKMMDSKLGFTGFREWALDDNPAPFDDGDSGPIISGIGTSATAFAIGASRALGDANVYLKLRQTETTVRSIIDLGMMLEPLARPVAKPVFNWYANKEGKNEDIYTYNIEQIQILTDGFLSTAIDFNNNTLPTLDQYHLQSGQ